MADGGAPRQLLLGTPHRGVRGPLDWPPSLAYVAELQARVRKLARAGKAAHAAAIRSALEAKGLAAPKRGPRST